MARQRIPIPFGGGLDRESGIFAAPPGSFEELVNVYVYEGKAVARRGASVVSQVTDDQGRPLSDLVSVSALRSRGEGVIVGWREADRKVHVSRTASDGTGPLHIPHEDRPEWFELDAGAATPPKVSAAESYDMMFLAHSEAGVFRRGPTVYYTPARGRLETLMADFDSEGEAPVRFHGVARHLSYLVGWGYGSPSESRPELVRVSLPGQPTVFQPEHYFIVGTRGDPVLACVPVGQVLLVFKGTETWEIFGYDRATFGVRPGDPLHGLLAPRLAVTVGDACFFWSASGPRMTTGGASVDLALPLDLGGPQPEELAEEGSAEDAFAAYLPARRAVLFVFGKRVYALNIRNPQSPRWTYQSLGIESISGGLLYPGVVQPVEPPGYADTLSTTELEPESVRLHWKNHAMVGDELIEVWLKPSDGPWTQRPAVPVASGTDQDHLLTGLEPGTDYEWALRAVRGGVYRDGYGGAPDTWPPESRGSFTTTITAPEITASEWERTSPTAARLNFTVQVSHPGLRVELLRDDTVVDFADPPLTSPVTLRDETMEIEEDHEYVVRQVTADLPEGGAADPVTRWAGPTEPANVVFDGGPPESAYWYRYEVTWNARAGRDVRIQDDYACADEFATRHTGSSDGSASITSLEKNSSEQDAGDNGRPAGFTARIRHEVTAHGVTDVSPWVSATVVVRIADDEDAFRACGGGGGNGPDPDPPPDPEPE